jgi:hypothetical protein
MVIKASWFATLISNAWAALPKFASIEDGFPNVSVAPATWHSSVMVRCDPVVGRAQYAMAKRISKIHESEWH